MNARSVLVALLKVSPAVASATKSFAGAQISANHSVEPGVVMRRTPTVPALIFSVALTGGASAMPPPVLHTMKPGPSALNGALPHALPGPGLTLTPTNLDFSVMSGNRQTLPLTMGNGSAVPLIFRIGPGPSFLPVPGSVPSPLTLSQTAASMPNGSTSICNNGFDTLQTSFWRRFSFAEAQGAAQAVNILGIELSTAGADVGASGSIATEVLVYSLAHATPVNTIPLENLTLLGSGLHTFTSGEVFTVPVPVAFSDAGSKDLVVEWRYANAPGVARFYPGSTTTAETHPAFISSPPEYCDIPDPTPLEVAAGDSTNHLLMVVHASQLGGTELFDCNPPSWLTFEHGRRGTIAAMGTAYTKVQVDTAAMDPGDYETGICVNGYSASGTAAKSQVEHLVVPVHVHVAVAL